MFDEVWQRLHREVGGRTKVVFRSTVGLRVFSNHRVSRNIKRIVRGIHLQRGPVPFFFSALVVGRWRDVQSLAWRGWASCVHDCVIVFPWNRMSGMTDLTEHMPVAPNADGGDGVVTLLIDKDETLPNHENSANRQRVNTTETKTRLKIIRR